MSPQPTAQCPRCNSQFAITNQALIGRTAPCPHCRHPFLVQPIDSLPRSVGTLPSPRAATQQWMQSQPPARRPPPGRSHLFIPLTVLGIAAFLFLSAAVSGVIWIAMRDGAEVEEETVAQLNDPTSPPGAPTTPSGERTPTHGQHRPSESANGENNTEENDAGESSMRPDANESKEPHRQPPPAQRPQAPRQETGSAPPRVSLRLSDAVFLPQTLPSGTAMTFSVAYEFTAGGPRTSSRYLWVISNRSGQSVDIPVPLQVKGKLPWAAVAWQKSEGPFKCRIEELSPSGNRSALCSDVTFR